MSKLSLHIGSEISLRDFSFSQLIFGVKNLFDTEGVPDLVKILVVLIERMLIRSGVECPNCKSSGFHRYSEGQRRVKTSIDEVILTLPRLVCIKRKITFVPFNRLFEIDPYFRKSREFEKLFLETVTNQRFRRSAKSLADIIWFSTSHTTLIKCLSLDGTGLVLLCKHINEG